MSIKLEQNWGKTFTQVAETAKRIAFDSGKLVEFEFNEVKCIISCTTNLDWLWRDYRNSWNLGWKTVGPDCVKKYSKEVQTKLNKRIKEKEEERKIEAAVYKKKQENKKLSLEQKTTGTEIELKDCELWEESRKNNSDPYGKAALNFAENWAKLMQYEINNGKTLIECAETTSIEADVEGITGFMYGCAVNILSQAWKYGEELKKWHNKEYGHEGEGVVNPALLIIKSK